MAVLEHASKTQPWKLAIRYLPTLPWSVPDPNSNQPSESFLKAREIAFKRDNWTCQGCDLNPPAVDGYPYRFLEVEHVDGNHKQSALSNLKTVCPLCHQVSHLAFHNENKTGRIGLSAIPQADIIRLAIVTAVLRIKDSLHPVSQHMERMYRDIEIHGVSCYQTFLNKDAGLGDPEALGCFMERGPLEQLERLSELAPDLRYFPKYTVPEHQPFYRFCASYVFGDATIDDLLTGLTEKLGLPPL